MNGSSRAWRFLFRQIDDRMGPGGITASPRGAVELVNEPEAVRQAILLLVATRPGERVMRPEYGCHLFRLAFSPNDDTTAGLAIHYVRSALDRWEPRIVTLEVDADANPDHPSRLDIQLHYRLRRRASSERLRVSYDLNSARVI